MRPHFVPRLSRGAEGRRESEEVCSIFSDIIGAVRAALGLLRLRHITTPSATSSICSRQPPHLSRCRRPLEQRSTYVSFSFPQETFATSDPFFLFFCCEAADSFPPQVIFTVISCFCETLLMSQRFRENCKCFLLCRIKR